MTGNMLDSQPAPYLRYLPNDTLVNSGGFQYHIWGGIFAYHSVSGNSTGLLMEENIDLRSQDPFSQGAVARLPTGLRYVRRGDIWLLVQIPGTTPVALSEQVIGHQEYWIIAQVPYTGGRPVANSLVIPFNVPMPLAAAGSFVGAHEAAFASSPGGAVKGKISISVDVLITASGNASLKSSSQVHAHGSKGRLAKVIAREVEKALATQSNVLVAFFNLVFVQELSFEDLFLVNLVQMSRSTYQPTIALRVRA